MDAIRSSPTNARCGDGRRDLLGALALTLLAWAHVFILPRFALTQPLTVTTAGLDLSPATPLTFLLTAAIIMPLALRRRLPLAVLAWTALGSAVYEALPQPSTLAVVAPLIALYTVGTLYTRRTLWVAAGLAFAVVLPFSVPGVPASRVIGESVRIMATFAFAASLGDATRARRAYIAEVEQRALDAEHTREEEARRRVEEERLRIGRELHDITAHSLSLIAVQAGAGERIVRTDPDAAAEAFAAIRQVSKSALDELRALLGVLRGDDESAPFAPAGRLSRLSELVGRVTAAGIEVALETQGDLDAVPAFADVSAYRIVQEALTNAVRHANATHVNVSLRATASELLLEITDDGRGSGVGETAEGHGISGMRERVAALGGKFEAGPGPDGGFRVVAELPYSRGGRGE
ncbi:MAG: sensor histidine kinase [Actinobacteria bacterium]|nr:MAG: sensor histidine kinase [Actinomycetota bacterium]